MLTLHSLRCTWLQDKSAAAEQLSYLKVQMQYALKEGEREVEDLTQRLQAVRG